MAEDAIKRIKEESKARNFRETVDTIIKLNVDPTKGDQMIRGTVNLPAGTGKEIRVCVFADKVYHEELREAGADIIGDEQILTDIAAGNTDFDKLLCTQEQLVDLKKFARVLGPKGLMPNTKSGTLVKQDEIVDQVKQSKVGLMEFRINTDAFIQSKIGLREFENGALIENFEALMEQLIAKKPESVKGRYFLKGVMKTTMGKPL